MSPPMIQSRRQKTYTKADSPGSIRSVCRLALGAVAFTLAACGGPLQSWETIVDCRADSARPGDITATWLGVAGLYLSDGTTGFLIDPFVSRYEMPIGVVVKNLPLRSNPGKVKSAIQRIGAEDAAAVVVSHSHYDHAVDAPEFSRQTDAPIYGSASTEKVALSYLNPRATDVGPGSEVTLGAFTVGFRESLHAGIVFGFVPDSGAILAPFETPAPRKAFRSGTVFALEITHPKGRILFTGSANSKPEMFAPGTTDADDTVLFLTLSGVRDIEGYLDATVGRTGATQVIPIHFDDLFQPQANPVIALDNARIDDIVSALVSDHPKARFRPLPAWQACPILPNPTR